MDHTYLTLTVLLCLFVNRVIYCYIDEPIMVNPQYRIINSYPLVNPHFQPMLRNPSMQQKQILHTRTIEPEQPQVTEEAPLKGYNFTFADFVEALNEISDDKEDRFRSAEHIKNPVYSAPHPAPYGYPPRPGFGSLLPDSPSIFPQSSSAHGSKDALKPGFDDLVEPLSKLTGKARGLPSMFSSLITGFAPPGLELNGLKDVFINGVIKPILAAKTSLKALIAKLVVPVIALVLINVEVLLVVWWLWEDCAKEAKLAEPPQPSPQPAYNYNNNNSYR